ncbi:STAS domain-containing protein [Thermosynechococcaceae cyanobacterium BACA0444]|uniref:Anti-sigma factor antagonist n=1 Tax=Pseudocalidococcus azoricus BACA0444 TaxID=2918990 RepID=A0AAE4FRI7_9CYAN|nr:STAS domain-containing protein [Pseudocalidococcus azoricus]MDS3860212.1 STAS domain-containing protein [Pseudocalidococcus azoricus BACA0444]
MSTPIKIIQPTGVFGGPQATAFRQEIVDLVQAGVTVVLIDCQEITFMDSSGLGALVVALKNLRTTNGQLFLCGVTEQVKMLFELTSMDKVFRILKDQAEFETTIRPTL